MAQPLARPSPRAGARARASKEEAQLDRLMRRLGDEMQRATGLSWLRPPRSKPARMVLGAVLLVAGLLGGWLPILGYWMVPLGLLLLAQDVPLLRRPVLRLMLGLERRWRRWRRQRHRGRAQRTTPGGPS